MRGFVAYSRPRGIYGRYIFTVLFYFSEPTESLEISVERLSARYSCHHCGKWATIKIPSEHRKSDTLEFYRYDDVEPTRDNIYLTMRDSDLLFYQRNQLVLGQDSPFWKEKQVFPIHSGFFGLIAPEMLYRVDLWNWDEYIQKNITNQRTFRIEEELIQQTMNAEPITITELLLQPASQIPAIEGEKQFIEGELRYLDK